MLADCVPVLSPHTPAMSLLMLHSHGAFNSMSEVRGVVHHVSDATSSFSCFTMFVLQERMPIEQVLTNKVIARKEWIRNGWDGD